MKLLFDQNISHRLAQTLSGLYPESTHVRLINLQSASDEEVWNCSTSEIEEVLVTHLEDIREFAIAEKSSFLILT